MTQIFDSHCHYNMSPLHENWSKFRDEAVQSGITHSLIVGSNTAFSAIALDLALANAQQLATHQSSMHMFTALGLHPTCFLNASEDSILPANFNFNQSSLKETKNLLTTEVTKISQLITDFQDQHPQHQKLIRAIGETGLEYFRLSDRADFASKIRPAQIHLFLSQIELANQLHLPLIIHNRDNGDGATFQDLIQLLSDHPPQNGFVLHCFAGPESYLQQGLKLGATISFAGNITFKSAHALRDALALTPPDRLMIETDAPFLAPEPHRGGFCHPAYITSTLRYITTHFPQFTPEQIYLNTIKFYQLD